MRFASLPLLLCNENPNFIGMNPRKRTLFNGVARIKRDNYSNSQTGWWTIRNEVFKRDGGKCQAMVGWGKCGQPATDVHHIISLNRGGTTTKGNLISLCKNCHEARHSHMRR